MSRNTLEVIVASTSDIKFRAVRNAFEQLGLGHVPVTGISAKSNIPEQPFGLAHGFKVLQTDCAQLFKQ